MWMVTRSLALRKILKKWEQVRLRSQRAVTRQCAGFVSAQSRRTQKVIWEMETQIHWSPLATVWERWVSFISSAWDIGWRQRDLSESIKDKLRSNSTNLIVSCASSHSPSRSSTRIKLWTLWVLRSQTRILSSLRVSQMSSKKYSMWLILKIWYQLEIAEQAVITGKRFLLGEVKTVMWELWMIFQCQDPMPTSKRQPVEVTFFVTMIQSLELWCKFNIQST